MPRGDGTGPMWYGRGLGRAGGNGGYSGYARPWLCKGYGAWSPVTPVAPDLKADLKTKADYLKACLSMIEERLSTFDKTGK